MIAVALLDKLAFGLSSKPLENLEYITRVLAEASLADACFVVVWDKAEFEIISYFGDMEILAHLPAFEQAAETKSPVIFKDTWLPQGLAGVMCVPIVMKINSRGQILKIIGAACFLAGKINSLLVFDKFP